jgi:hypothetical protein
MLSGGDLPGFGRRLRCGLHSASCRARFNIYYIIKGISYGPLKSRPTAVNLLAEFSPHFYQENQKLFSKHVMPLLIKLTDETKGDMKQAATKLIVTLDELCSEELRGSLPLTKLTPFLK